MNGLDLFSGIGGIGLALEPWVRTVAYCERELYAQGVLLSRMQSGEIDIAPIWDDVTTLRGEMLPKIDIIFGGFPCQDLSVAGHGKGLAGERSGLFFEIIRLVKEISPSFVFLENVPAIRTRGLSEVVNAFTEIGYDCRWTCISAASVGAPHKRERWFLLAYSNSMRERLERYREKPIGDEKKFSNSCIYCNEVSNSNVQGCCKQTNATEKIQSKRGTKTSVTSGDWWGIEPSVGRVANGIPHRIHRIKCLGNGVVPLQVQTAFKKLIGF